MYLIAIGWLYVALMMSVAEAVHPDGTVLGAVFTFALYGLLPLGLVLYVLRTPQRRAERQERERESDAAARAAGALALAQAEASIEPDTSGHAPSATEQNRVAPVGKPD
jgi:hypothetical protein